VSLILECELGYTFDPAAWRQGYAGEAAQCVRDYARDGLGLGYVVSAILPGNARSRRVAERAGAWPDGQMEAAGLTFDRWVWRL
jgi:RimJ/RimL family protein N-acetyltransferase